MMLGWYEPTGLGRAALVRDVGYDYIELALAPLGIEAPGAVAHARRRAQDSPLPTLVWGSFFPRDLRIVDPGVDVRRIRDYVGRAAEFLQFVGARVAVMGSAWTRNLPAGGDPVRAEAQVLQALEWTADAFRGTGVTIGLEAQNHLECNCIRRVGEAISIAKKLDRPEVRVTADFYHMQMENEPLDVLAEAGAWICHVQVADTGRTHPGNGSYPFDALMEALKAGGYRGNISVECMVELPEAAMRHSHEFLRGKVGLLDGAPAVAISDGVVSVAARQDAVPTGQARRP